MNLTDELGLIACRGRLERNIGAAGPEEIAATLIEGWDATANILCVDPPGFGIWRAPHLYIGRQIAWPDKGLRPILDSGMSVADLAAGLWRQLRILPVGEDWRLVGVVGEASDNPFRPDDDLSTDDTRDIVIRCATGHTVSDAADYLADLIEREPRVGRLMLAKRFGDALHLRPSLLHSRWPQSCHKRWEKEGGRDFLPPFLHQVLLAELARGGQNQAGLLALSFDADGNDLSLAVLRNELEAVSQSPISAATERLLELAPLQTTALLPPDIVYGDPDLNRRPDRDLGRAWSQGAVGSLVLLLNEHGPEILDAMSPDGSPHLARLVAGAQRAHPNLQNIVRQGRGSAMRKGKAATYWSLPWPAHGALAALLVARQARAWSAKYRLEADRLPDQKNRKIGIPLSMAQTVGAITHLWLESHSPVALAKALEHIKKTKAGACAPDEREARLAELKTEHLDDLIGDRHFGGELYKSAEELLTRIPQPGGEGYTALYHPHLWFQRRGDDLVCYRRFEQQARDTQRRLAISSRLLPDDACSRVPADVIQRTGMGKGYGLARSARARALKAAAHEDREAALDVQNIAMVVSVIALDPMRAFLSRTWGAASKHPAQNDPAAASEQDEPSGPPEPNRSRAPITLG